jgi:AcrR family transcriptional regulator
MSGGRGRGRRPADEVRADVLHAAGELILTEGLADLTFERIARLSGVSKTTLYKWWPSRGALALDGYFHAVEPALAFADTGDLREDLRAQLHAFAALMATPGGRALLQLVAQAQTDPDLAASLGELYTAPRRRLAEERLERAQAAGALREDVQPRVLVDQLWGAVYYRLLAPDGLAVGPAYVDALIDHLFDGIAAS